MVSVSHSRMCLDSCLGLGLVLKMCMHIAFTHLALQLQRKVAFLTLLDHCFLVGVYIRYVEVLPNTRRSIGQVLHLVQFLSHLDRVFISAIFVHVP